VSPRPRRAPAGGAVQRLLSLPARLHLRWLVIALVTAAAVLIYGRVLTGAAPMPPSRGPDTGYATWSPSPAP
jgi:hypothetical protein